MKIKDNYALIMGKMIQAYSPGVSQNLESYIKGKGVKSTKSKLVEDWDSQLFLMHDTIIQEFIFIL